MKAPILLLLAIALIAGYFLWWNPRPAINPPPANAPVAVQPPAEFIEDKTAESIQEPGFDRKEIDKRVKEITDSMIRLDDRASRLFVDERTERYLRVHDQVNDFEVEFEEGKFGFLPETKAHVQRILSPQAAVVSVQMRSKDSATTSHAVDVVISGLLTAGYDEGSKMTLWMPFQVVGKQRVGDKLLVKLEAIPIRPVRMPGSP